MIFKIHTCAYYDVYEQTRAVEEVAPPGFKMHYDFNHNRPLAAVLRILAGVGEVPRRRYDRKIPWSYPMSKAGAF